MTSRSRQRHENEDDDFSDEQETSRRRRRNSDDDGKRQKSRSRYDDDDEYEEEKDYRSSKKEKETKTTKTRRRANDDDFSDDQSPRRDRRRREDRSPRNRRQNIDYSDEEDDRPRRRHDEKENRRSRRRYDDEDDEDDEEYDRRRSDRSRRRRRDDTLDEDEDYSPPRRNTRRARQEDSEEEPKRSSRGSRRRDQEDDESPVRSSRRSKRNQSEEDEESKQKQKSSDVQEEEDADDLMTRWKNRPNFEELQKDEELVDSSEEVTSNPFEKYSSKQKDESAPLEDDNQSDNQIQRDDSIDQESEPIAKKNPFAKYGQETQESTNSRQSSVDVEDSKKVEEESKISNVKNVGKVSLKKFGSSNSSTSSFDKSSIKPSTESRRQNSLKQQSIDAASKPAKQPESKDGEEEGMKKRRRDKDASSSILDVINWNMGGSDKYDGSSEIPEIKEPVLASTPVKKAEKNKSEEKKVENEEGQSEKPIQNGFKHDTEAPQVNGNTEEPKVDEIKSVTDEELQDSLKYLDSLPDIGNLSKSSTLSSLMDTYLNSDYLVGRSKPSTISKPPRARSLSGDIAKMEELEENLKLIRAKNKKQPPPPTRNKPTRDMRNWEDPREQQRQKNKEKAWPPKEPPKDVGAYVVESYGQTDPYSKRLIKDIQRSKREDEEKKEAEKRAEIVADSTKPVSTLRSTFAHKPAKPWAGAQKPEAHVSEERSWIKHEKKDVVFDKPPDEPDWMTLIRNRRWQSTVKARFPCKLTDKTDFERRSTTPKNWKRLAKDKNALMMLSEIVGIGAEGEELFMRLASQRQKIEDEEEEIDRLTEEDLMAYEVARETLGEDAAYSLQMDNPLPAARMRPVLSSTSTVKETDDAGSEINMSVSASSAYPFTTSQLEAAYLTNQLLRLHPEEFRKLMSLEKSRQATLRWQFSADPFDSVHEHQTLPLEIALLASEEPRVQQAMKRILAKAQGGSGGDSVFEVPRRAHRTRSDGGYSHSYYGGSESEYDGYESSRSLSSSSSFSGVPNQNRGRVNKKKPVPPPVRPRGRSVSPSMLNQRQDSSENYSSGPTLTVPRLNAKNAKIQLEEDREIHAHGLLTDEDLALSEEIAKLQELTSNIGRDINEELKSIESSLADRKKGFYEEQIRRDVVEKTNAKESIDINAIAKRRTSFIGKDHESSVNPDVRGTLPETRHKVQRINSSAQLDAVFGGRRQISESDMEDNDDDDDLDKRSKKKSTKPENNEAKQEMSDLLKDITSTYGE